MGYNGFPRGIDDTEERLLDRPLKYSYTVHGEINAILNATKSVEGCTLYTYPLPCCENCANIVIQSGITKVISFCKKGWEERWKNSCKKAINKYKEAGIEVTLIEV